VSEDEIFSRGRATDLTGESSIVAYMVAIARDRYKSVLALVVAGILASTLAYFLVRPSYTSSATMLVQSPQLPNEVVGGWENEVIDRRIALIRQELTSRPSLISLINSKGLYQEERADRPMSEIVDEMKDAISIEPTVADLPQVDPTKRTIAFKVEYSYRDPSLAQQVAQSLTDRIIELDASRTSDQASDTLQFLSNQSADLEKQIATVQADISQLTAQNGLALSSAGGVITDNSANFEVQIAALQRENSSLIAQRNAASSASSKNSAVLAAEASLAAARAVYSDSHPDVILAKQRLAEAKAFAKANSTSDTAIASIDNQIAFNNRQIASLQSLRASDRGAMQARLAAQSRAPTVQQKLNDLNQVLSGLNDRYESIQKQYLSAKQQFEADNQQMGERLTVVESPIVADEPSFPKLFIFLALGAGVGLAIGLVIAGSIEFVSRPIRSPTAIAAITGRSPLAIIPVIYEEEITLPEKIKALFTRLKLAIGKS